MVKKVVYLVLLLNLVSSCNPMAEKEDTSTTSEGSTDGGGSSGDSGGGADPEPVYRKLFISQTSLKGNGNGGGFDDFDDTCSTDATGLGLSGTYKALITHSINRFACSTSECSGGVSENTGWVLEPDMEYRRVDGTTVIGSTNSAAILSFPLTNSISDTSDLVWTGLYNDWTNATGFFGNCNDFTGGTSYGASTVGESNSTNTTAISTGGQERCDFPKKVICVEQEPPATPTGPYKIIFETANTYLGGSGYSGNDGVNEFDGHCANEASSLGHSGTYKAMIMANTVGGNTARYACLSANCGSGGASENVNWVLAANTNYRRADGTTHIGTTNAAGIFELPLSNSFTGNSNTYWTGFTSSFAINNTSSQANTCLNWTYKEAGGTGYTGLGNKTDAKAFMNTGSTCASSHRILCVEQ